MKAVASTALAAALGLAFGWALYAIGFDTTTALVCGGFMAGRLDARFERMTHDARR